MSGFRLTNRFQLLSLEEENEGDSDNEPIPPPPTILNKSKSEQSENHKNQVPNPTLEVAIAQEPLAQVVPTDTDPPHPTINIDSPKEDKDENVEVLPPLPPVAIPAAVHVDVCLSDDKDNSEDEITKSGYTCSSSSSYLWPQDSRSGSTSCLRPVHSMKFYSQEYGGTSARVLRRQASERSLYKRHWNRIWTRIKRLSGTEISERVKWTRCWPPGSSSYSKNKAALKTTYQGFSKRIVKAVLHKGKLNPYYYYKYLIVIDFEATCDNTKDENFPHEIIQFPAILIDCEALEVVGEFNYYVKPVKNPMLTDFCTELTGITQDLVDNGKRFPEILNLFNKWVEELLSIRVGPKDFAIVVDGPCDAGKFLYNQCMLSGVPYPSWANQWINLRITFEEFYDVPWYKLITTIEVLGLVHFIGNEHNGLDDSRNIARVLKRLLEHGSVPVPNERILLSPKEQLENPRIHKYDLPTVKRLQKRDFLRTYEASRENGNKFCCNRSNENQNQYQPHQSNPYAREGSDTQSSYQPTPSIGSSPTGSPNLPITPTREMPIEVPVQDFTQSHFQPPIQPSAMEYSNPVSYFQQQLSPTVPLLVHVPAEFPPVLLHDAGAGPTLHQHVPLNEHVPYSPPEPSPQQQQLIPVTLGYVYAPSYPVQVLPTYSQNFQYQGVATVPAINTPIWHYTGYVMPLQLNACVYPHESTYNQQPQEQDQDSHNSASSPDIPSVEQPDAGSGPPSPQPQ